MAIIIDNKKEILKRKKNEYGLWENFPKLTFIPIKEAIMVGIDITIVIPAKNFIIPFKLFEITVATVSVVLLSIPLYKSAILLAWLFSIIASSSKSSSSK